MYFVAHHSKKKHVYWIYRVVFVLAAILVAMVSVVYNKIHHAPEPIASQLWRNYRIKIHIILTGQDFGAKHYMAWEHTQHTLEDLP